MERPGILLEIKAENEQVDLSRRQADIAIRLIMPNELQLAAQLAGKMRFGLYTVPAYEAFFGMPKTLEKLFPHRIIDHSTLGASQLHPWHGIVSNHTYVAYCTNSSVFCQWAIQAGYDISLFPNYTAKIFRSLIPVPVELEIEAPIWLVSHEETNKIACTRIVLEYIRDLFAKDCAE